MVLAYDTDRVVTGRERDEAAKRATLYSLSRPVETIGELDLARKGTIFGIGLMGSSGRFNQRLARARVGAESPLGGGHVDLTKKEWQPSWVNESG